MKTITFLIFLITISSCSLLKPKVFDEKIEIIKETNEDRTALHNELNEATFFSRLKKIEMILTDNPNLINEKEENTQHIFNDIAFFNKIEVLKLIESLADKKIISIDTKGIKNPIINASRNNLELVKIFYEFGFSLHFKDSLGRDILDIAKDQKDIDLENWLIEKKYKRIN